MLSIQAHGWTRNLPAESKLYSKMDDEFYESFNFLMPGYNLRPLEMEATIGIEQLKKLDRFVEQRRKNAAAFKEMMREYTDALQIQKEIGKSSWFGFAIILTGKLTRKRALVIQKLKEAGIEVRPIVAGNFTRQKALEYMEYSIYRTLENADYIHENGFFVGNHSVDLEEALKYLLENIHKYIYAKSRDSM